MAKPPGKCIFCGGSGLSKEHVFPEWIQKILPKTETHTVHTIERPPGPHGQPNTLKMNPSWRPIRQGDPLVRKLYVVCKACNSGWMSRLQTRAKPILIPLITGEWQELTVEDQLIVASWFAMTAMVYEFADPPTVGITYEERRAFSQTQIPPSHWYIWIGRFEGVGDRNRFHFGLVLEPEPYGSIMEYLRQSTGEAPTCNAHMTTFTLGKLLLHGYGISSPVMRIVLAPEYGFRLGIVPFWPIKGQAIRAVRVIDDEGAYKIGRTLNLMLLKATEPGA